MTRLTVEYIVEKESSTVPDDVIMKAIVEHPIEMSFTSSDGKQYTVTLTPDLTYPTTVTT